MADSDIIILSDIVKRDLYCHDNIDDAIAELMDIAANMNRSSLYFAWAVGKFAENRKLKTQYGIESHAQLARLMGTSDMSITRYCSVYKLLTEEQLKQLGSMRISTSAVLEIATAQSNGYKDEAKLLLDSVLNNEISTAAEIKGSFKSMLMEKTKQYNLLPGGEAPAGDSTEGSLSEDIEEVEFDSKSPADRIIDAEEVLDTEDKDVGDRDDAESDGSMNKQDAVMMLKTVRQTIVAMRRDMVQIWRDLPSEVASVMEAQSVILGDAAASDEFDDMMSAMYLDMREALTVLIEQTAKGAEYGYVQNQVKMPKEGRTAFCGCGLFMEEQ